MLIDLHAHSSGISPCCLIPYEQVLHTALEHGIDGLVLTNHYVATDDPSAFARRYVDEFFAARQYGQSIGCRVFFGIELTMVWDPAIHLLIYGVEPEFVLNNPSLFACTQQELYALVKANDGVLVQAHPYRNGKTVLDPAYLDGVEINCHPIYKQSYSERLLPLAAEHRLLVTCGGDYHADTYRPTCGMELPETVQTSGDLRNYLLSQQPKTLQVQEPNTETVTTITVSHETPARY